MLPLSGPSRSSSRHLNQFLIGVREADLRSTARKLCSHLRKIHTGTGTEHPRTLPFKSAVVALDCVVYHQESDKRVAVISAGLTMEPFSQVSQDPEGSRWKRYRYPELCLHRLNCCDSTLKRIVTAACRDQCVKSRVCRHQSLCCLGTTLRRSTSVLRLRQLSLIIRMLFVPVLNASFVTFPSA